MPALPPDDDIAWKVWVGSIVGVVSATVAVAARLYARKLSAAHFWWDDLFIVLALVMQWSMGIVRWIILCNYNYGRHIQYVGRENVLLFWKVSSLQPSPPDFVKTLLNYCDICRPSSVFKQHTSSTPS